MRGLWLSAVLAVADQASKWWILLDIMNPPRAIEVLPFFNLVLVWNQGISFGMLQTGAEIGRWALIALAGVVCGMLLVMFRDTTSRPAIIAVGLVVGGAVGNVIDRLVHGAVVDFIDLHAAGLHWPAFNIADSAIVIGAGLLILDSLTANKHNKKDQPADG